MPVYTSTANCGAAKTTELKHLESALAARKKNRPGRDALMRANWDPPFHGECFQSWHYMAYGWTSCLWIPFVMTPTSFNTHRKAIQHVLRKSGRVKLPPAWVQSTQNYLGIDSFCSEKLYA